MELEIKSNKTGPGRTKRSKVSSDHQNIESDFACLSWLVGKTEMLYLFAS